MRYTISDLDLLQLHPILLESKLSPHLVKWISTLFAEQILNCIRRKILFIGLDSEQNRKIFFKVKKQIWSKLKISEAGGPCSDAEFPQWDSPGLVRSWWKWNLWSFWPNFWKCVTPLPRLPPPATGTRTHRAQDSDRSPALTLKGLIQARSWYFATENFFFPQSGLFLTLKWKQTAQICSPEYSNDAETV